MEENRFNKYLKDGSIYRSEGCNNEELIKISNQVKSDLPGAYKDFLKIAGREFNSYDQIRFGWDGISNIKNVVKHYLRISGKTVKIKESDVFFWQDEYNFGLFNLEEGENPPIYWFYICQAENKFCKVANSFTEFIELLIKEKTAFQKSYTNDMVLLKKILRQKGEILDFDESNLKYLEKIIVPDKIFRIINKGYSGLEQELALKLTHDLIKEKAKFIFKNIEILSTIFDIAKNDFSRLNYIYYYCVIRNLDENFDQLIKNILLRKNW